LPGVSVGAEPCLSSYDPRGDQLPCGPRPAHGDFAAAYVVHLHVADHGMHVELEDGTIVPPHLSRTVEFGVVALPFGGELPEGRCRFACLNTGCGITPS